MAREQRRGPAGKGPAQSNAQISPRAGLHGGKATTPSVPVARRKAPRCSKYHYVAVASILKLRGGDKGLIKDFADWFEDDNPRFDRAAFERAGWA